MRDELKAQTQKMFDYKAEAEIAKSSAEFHQKELDRYAGMLKAAEDDRLRFHQETVSARVSHIHTILCAWCMRGYMTLPPPPLPTLCDTGEGSARDLTS